MLFWNIELQQPELNGAHFFCLFQTKKIAGVERGNSCPNKYQNN